MARLIKKRSSRTGLPPGALVYIGDTNSTQTRIRVVQFDNDEYEEKELQSIDECKPYIDRKDKTTWIHVEGVSNEALIERIGSLFSISHLILEDVLDTDHRPKIEEHSDCFFAILKLIQLESRRGYPPLTSEQMSFIHAPNYVLSVQETHNPLFDSIVNRLKKSKGRVRHSGADYLLAVLMDAVVDQYFLVIEHIGEQVEQIENEVANDPKRTTLKKINLFRNELIFLKKNTSPIAGALSLTTRADSRYIRPTTQQYFHGIHDHALQLKDTIDSYMDIIGGHLDIYLSSMNQKLNEVMKVLAIFSAVFSPLTFIVGIYGMNFQHMPEYDWKWSYPILWVIMLSVGVGMFFFFKRKKWL